jgi:SAM-dependent methyltransferase
MFDVFTKPDSIEINTARLKHLASLELCIAGKIVLEVGAGIGLHTEFFENLGCGITSTDARLANVDEMRRRYPKRYSLVLDIEDRFSVLSLGMFDIVYAYGVLYHLPNPENALALLAQVCKEFILVESCVSLGDEAAINPVPESSLINQSMTGIGCRPTRNWYMSKLKKYFGYAYTTITQPNYRDYLTDWSDVTTPTPYRAVFIGSKIPIVNKNLSESLLNRQVAYGKA